MSEVGRSGMRQKVVKGMKPLDALPVENPMQPGTPDVNYLHGWIELKWLPSWPKGRDTIVRCNHYTPQQRAFARRRAYRGGKVHLLLQVKREWLLFDGVWAAFHFGNVTRQELIEGSERYWSVGMNWEDLCKWLSSDSTVKLSPSQTLNA